MAARYINQRSGPPDVMLIATERKEGEGASKVEILFWNHPHPEWKVIRSAEVL